MIVLNILNSYYSHTHNGRIPRRKEEEEEVRFNISKISIKSLLWMG
jgi:hypothetical protein